MACALLEAVLRLFHKSLLWDLLSHIDNWLLEMAVPSVFYTININSMEDGIKRFAKSIYEQKHS